MTQLAPIELEDGTVIYVEATEKVNVAEVKDETKNEEEVLVTRGGGMTRAIQKFKSIEGTIRAYTTHTLNAFKEIADANVDKVTLEFGIKVGGEAGIPYVTKGTAESNLKITVECSFPK
jgi:hypothetical protein